jgi:hypothetical protein
MAALLPARVVIHMLVAVLMSTVLTFTTFTVMVGLVITGTTTIF